MTKAARLLAQEGGKEGKFKVNTNF